jgi:HK97 family phage prohead protease
VSDSSSPPRESLIRAAYPAVEFRDATDDELAAGHLGLLRVLFSPVNEWTEINSMWEGQFMERFAPGAWKKTIADQRDRIRSLFQHGMDPQVGDKPLGPITRLEETDRGGYGEVPLLDTSYNRDLLPGLKAGLYGASHRFSVLREDIVEKPEPSPSNPRGLQERTVKEARLMEFGPVTFPAYAGATAGVRSLTDEFLKRCFDRDPAKVRAMFAHAVENGEQRMDSEDVGTLAEMLVCSNTYIEEQDEGSPMEAAAILAMQAIQADLIKLMNVEAAEDEPLDEPEDERAQKDPAPSTADAATSTSAPERRDPTRPSGLVLPARSPRVGLTLKPKEQPSWPFR